MKAHEIFAIGFEEGKAFGLALDYVNAREAEAQPAALETLKEVLETPEDIAEEDPRYVIAQALLEWKTREEIPLKEETDDYRVYGVDGIEEGALKQMNVAMKLPVTHSGALMPDAHQGYGLPIGGVLATNNAVIPYGVGVDIGCRMCMSIYDMPAETVNETKRLKKLLKNNSRFGRATFDRKMDHEVLARPEFDEIPVVKGLHQRAAAQIGSSGGGNHFVEFGIVEVTEEENGFGVKPGKYLGLLTHSGSRGLGANIANHYTKLAMQLCKLPQEAKHLAWLDLDTEAGQEYWIAMNLAGDYASACHHQIHERMAVGLRTTPLAMIENHHNFAWKERHYDRDLIVHRKGATPAGPGVLGIIPGTMATPAYVVRGKGNAASLHSAAHGAGRVMSRTRAKKTLDWREAQRRLADAGVTLLSAGLDEVPMVYKDIDEVMGQQSDLVEPLARFHPRIVKMAPAGEKPED